MATQIRVTTQEDSVNASRVVYLDLSDSQPMTANYQFKDIQDFKSTKGNHTFNFRIPSTPNNDLFFGDYFEVTQFGNYNPKIKVEATILKDTFDVFEGYLQLTNVFVSNDVTHHYECVVFSSVSTLGQVLQGKYLTEFDWSEYDHSITQSNVLDSMNRDVTPLLNGDIVYSMYDYGSHIFGGGTEGSSGNEATPLNVMNLRPQIRLSKVLKKILNASGYTYASTFIDSEMTDVYIDMNNGNEAPQTNTSEFSYKVDVGSDGTQTFPASNGFHTVINNNTTGFFYTNQSGEYDETTGIYNPSDLWVMTTMQHMVRISGTPADVDGTLAFLCVRNLTDNILLPVTSPQGTFVDGEVVLTISAMQYMLDTSKTYDVVVLIMNTTDATATITIDSGNIRYRPLSYVTVGGTEFDYNASVEFQASRNFAKIKALDFITSIAKKFNLVIIPDELNPTHLYIEPYKDWIDDGNNVDWTEKLDVSKDVQLKPTADLQAKSIIFSDAQSDDVLNTNFKQVNERIYGSQYVDNTSNDFGKDKEEIKTIFIPIISRFIPSTDIISCICYNTEGTNSSAVRLSYYSGYVTTNSDIWFNDTIPGTSAIQKTSFSLFQNYEDAVFSASTKCLSFMGEQNNNLGYPGSLNGAYSVYWKRFLEETYSREARILTGTFFLTALDIQSMNFNDIVFVKNEYFRINKILNYPLVGSSSCQIELIKVQMVDLLDVNGASCLVSPSQVLGTGQVVFINNATGVVEVPSETCCEAFGYVYNNTDLICYNTTFQPDNPSEEDPTGGDGNNIGGGNNQSTGVFNQIIGNNNSASNFSQINGNNNTIVPSSNFNIAQGNKNKINALVNNSSIKGGNNLLNPYSLNWTGASFKVYSRQTFKNNSLQGDYGLALGNGEEFLSGGADSLYNQPGRSGSGHFVKHAFSDSQEIVFIGQNGMFTFGTDYFYSQSINFFRLEFPSMISFEINVVGHDRGTASSRSQEYSFRKYSGTILNTNNSGTVSIKDFTLDTQKETSNFTDYSFTLSSSYVVTDRPVGGGDLVYIDDGMFYMYINTNGANKLGIVDWTIDFKYTLVGLQNLGRSSGLPIFTPTQISGCLLWVDASDPTTITHSGGVVSQWDDLSGNNHHLTQSTASYKPTYSSVVPYPYIKFDGNNQVLGNQASSLINASDGDNTIFVVFKSDSTTTSTKGETIAGICYRASQLYGININNTITGAGGSSFMNKSTQDYLNRVATIPSTTKQVLIGTRASGTREIFDQDGNTDIDTNSSNTLQDTFVVGATWDGTSRSPVQDYSGEIYEVIVYGVKVTEAQRNQVQNYLQTKWNT